MKAATGWDARRAVQTVVVDTESKDMFWFGSGYLVTAELILTAAHVLHGAHSATVRFFDAPGRMRSVQADAVFTDASADVAVLRLRAAQPAVPSVVFGYPQGPMACDAVGFPRFNLNDDHRAAGPGAGAGPDGQGSYRDSHHAEGRCRPASLVYAGTLALDVPAPERDPDPDHSPWEGMSGAAVFAGGALIAVVAEHHKRQGPGALTATRVDSWYRLLDEPGLTGLRQLLGLADTAEHLTAVGSAAVAVAAGPMSLPRDATTYTGRTRDLEQLVAELDRAGRAGAGAVLGIHAVDGMAGVGKTAFAVHAAHALAGKFPDGQWFLRLHGHTPGTAAAEPDQVLADLLTADGMTLDQIPPGAQARADAWRIRTAGRRMLLVLDDAASSAQVRPLLPSAPGTLVLVTSRRRLTGLADAIPVGLDVLDSAEASAMFARIAARPLLRPDDPQVEQVVGLCGYLPLAIGMVAARLRHHRSWSIQDIVEELTAASGRLPTLAAEDLSVAAAFELSYRDLNTDQQRLFRAVGASPAVDTDTAAVAAMLHIDQAQARRLLADLEEHRLLDEPVRGRYRMHDLLREHARASAEATAQEIATDIDRLMAYYPHADDHRSRGLSFLRIERANMLACLGHARKTASHTHLIALTAALEPLLRIDGPWPQAVILHAQAAATAEQLGDRPGLARALNDLGRARYKTGDYAGALRDHQQALELFEQQSDRSGQASVLNDLGRVRHVTGDYAGALRDHQQALELFEQQSDRSGQASVLNDLGRVRRMTGDYAGALRDHQQALELFEQLGDRPGLARALNDLGRVRYMTDDYAGALRDHQQALELFEQQGDRSGQASALNNLGRVQLETGDYAGALRDQQRALELLEQLGDRVGYAFALSDVGRARQETGDYTGALRDQQRALELLEQLGDRSGHAWALNDLGRVRRMTGDYAGALRDHQQAQGLFEQLGTRFGQASVLNDLGRVRQGTGDYAGALRDHQQALELFEQLGDRSGKANALDGLGECHRRVGETVQAAVILRQALTIYRELGLPLAENVAARLAELDLENTDSLN